MKNLIGPGDCSGIKNSARMLGVEQNVELIGAVDNPYPYMDVCDIYVQPSRYEGNSVTVREAQMLYKPVVITNYNTASNQVQSGVDGIICELRNEAIANAIYDLAIDNTLQQSIVQNLLHQDYGNEQEIEKIYQLLCI